MCDVPMISDNGNLPFLFFESSYFWEFTEYPVNQITLCTNYNDGVKVQLISENKHWWSQWSTQRAEDALDSDFMMELNMRLKRISTPLQFTHLSPVSCKR